jgi:type II secretory pathway component PulF
MSDEERTVIAIVVVAAVGLLGGLCVTTVAVVRGSYGLSPSAGKRWFLRIFGGTLVVLGLGGAIAMAAGIVYSVLTHGDNAEALAFATAALMLLAMLALQGVLLFLVAKDLEAAPIGAAGSPQIDRKLTIVASIGWAYVVLALVASRIGILCGLLVLTIVEVWAAHRRMARYSGLLWTLTVAAERQLPLPAEIEALASTLQGKHRFRLQTLAARLRAGVPLSDALAEGKGLLPQQTITAIHAATETGTVAATLREHAAEQDARIDAFAGGSSVTWVLTYYSIMIPIVVLISVRHLYLILPMLNTIVFEDFNVKPGPQTNWLERLSSLESGLAFFALAIAIVFLLGWLIVFVGSFWTANWRNLRAPWLTRWFLRWETPWILRTLADTVDSGRPLPLGLAPLAVTYFRPHVRHKLSQVENEVVEGRDCWSALNAAGFIKSSEAALLKAGSTVGNLGWTLRTLADRIQQRQRHRLKCLIEAAWPLCVLCLGVYVFWLCLSIFVPLISLLTQLD